MLAGVRARPFVVVGLALGASLALASAPSPLYAVWAATYGFGAGTLTAVFAVYAVGLLAALLTTGTLSDALGRRPVVLLALLAQAAATALFLLAGSLPVLVAGRLVQGVATGVITAAVSAWLLDTEPRRGDGALASAAVPTGGLAAGALVAGALVEHAPAPQRLVWGVMLVVLLVLALAVSRLPEPPGVRGPVDLRPRIAVPTALRGAFLAATPTLVCTWALGGLYLSLGPSLVLDLARSDDRLLGALTVVALAGGGTAATLLLHRLPPVAAARGGSVALVLGVLVSVAAVPLGSTVLFLLGTLIAGSGFGPAFLNALRGLLVLAPADQRGALLSAVYLVSYSAFSAPALVAGLAVSQVGLRPTAVAYGLAVAALAALPLLPPALRLATARRRAAQ